MVRFRVDSKHGGRLTWNSRREDRSPQSLVGRVEAETRQRNRRLDGIHESLRE
jgi:hypothetical protein